MPEPHRNEAVLFDMDGVLLTTDEYHYRSWQALGEAYGVPLARETFDQRMRGLERPAALAVFLEGTGRTFTDEERTAMAAEKQRLFLEIVAREGVRPLPGVVELIADLKRAGAKIGVGSSSRNTRPLLLAAGLLSNFAAVVDANDCRAKPEPDIYLEVARQLGVGTAEDWNYDGARTHRCVVIEDAVDGIEAARRAGMAVLALGPAERFTDVKYRVSTLEGVSAEWILSLERDEHALPGYWLKTTPRQFREGPFRTHHEFREFQELLKSDTDWEFVREEMVAWGVDEHFWRHRPTGQLWKLNLPGDRWGASWKRA